jgi:chemotaxis protein CheC
VVGRKPTASDGPVVSLEIDVRKLGSSNRMAKEGGNTVASHLGQMTDVETEMEITKIDFVDVPDIETHVGDETWIGSSVELVEPPHRHVLFLFNAASAKELARGTIGDMADSPQPEEGFSDMERSAIEEIGNITTAGFIDGWANVLETPIDMSMPTFTDGPSSGLIDELVGQRDDEVALGFESHVHGLDADVDVTVYPFPELEELVELMHGIPV